LLKLVKLAEGQYLVCIIIRKRNLKLVERADLLSHDTTLYNGWVLSCRKLIFLSFYLFIGLAAKLALAQNVAQEISANDEVVAAAESLPTEIVRKISPSGRIFIMSNANSSVGKGDFITLIVDSDRALRALVAKTTDDVAGIKILKIYDPNLFKLIKQGSQVKVLRGDDSYFKKVLPTEDLKIKDTEDLYNDTVLSDGIEIDDNTKRAIKTDNIVGVALSQVPVVDAEGESTYDSQLSAQWAYQFYDNFWSEVNYGQHLIEDYPSPGLGTKLSNLVLRLKYTIEAPLDSYFMPYVGYQYLNASSPGAGEIDPSLNQNQTFYDNEIAKVEDLKKSGPIIGATILKRFVPGWFFRADLGTDNLAFGISLEF
jgi:hypothetical protein